MFYKMIDHQNKNAFKQGFIDLRSVKNKWY